MRAHSCFLAGAAALAALTLTACGGGDPTIKTTGYAKAIQKSVLDQHNQVVKVECPAEVKKKKGEAFTCNVKLEVGTYPVTVTMVDDKGAVKYGNSTPLTLLDTGQVQHAIGVEIRHQRHLGSKVSCPKQVLQKQGLTFFCTAKVQDGVTTRFKVQQTDDKGHVTFVGL